MIEPGLIQIAIGMSILSIVGLYIGWRSYRVFLLRLKLLKTRNELWDRARDLNALDDRAYLHTRSILNSLIRHSHRVDLVKMALSQSETETDVSQEFKSGSEELDLAINSAISDVAHTIGRYVVWYRPFTGILVIKSVQMLSQFISTLSLVRVAVNRVQIFTAKLDQSVADWFRHEGPNRMKC